jgi:hypothetical protein
MDPHISILTLKRMKWRKKPASSFCRRSCVRLLPLRASAPVPPSARCRLPLAGCGSASSSRSNPSPRAPLPYRPLSLAHRRRFLRPFAPVTSRCRSLCSPRHRLPILDCWFHLATSASTTPGRAVRSTADLPTLLPHLPIGRGQDTAVRRRGRRRTFTIERRPAGTCTFVCSATTTHPLPSSSIQGLTGRRCRSKAPTFIEPRRPPSLSSWGAIPPSSSPPRLRHHRLEVPWQECHQHGAPLRLRRLAGAGLWWPCWQPTATYLMIDARVTLMPEPLNYFSTCAVRV